MLSLVLFEKPFSWKAWQILLVPVLPSLCRQQQNTIGHRRRRGNEDKLAELVCFVGFIGTPEPAKTTSCKCSFRDTASGVGDYSRAAAGAVALLLPVLLLLPLLLLVLRPTPPPTTSTSTSQRRVYRTRKITTLYYWVGGGGGGGGVNNDKPNHIPKKTLRPHNPKPEAAQSQSSSSS